MKRYKILREMASFFLLGISLISASCLPPGQLAKQENSTVEGQLVDQGGRPVSQYAVKIEGVNNGTVSSVAFTDFSGNFQFLNLPAGQYRIYPLNEAADQGRVIEVHGGKQDIGLLKLRREIKVELNKDAAKTIDPKVAQAINPDAAQTLNPEAAKTINIEAAKMINPEAAKTINWEAAQTINPKAAKTINPDAAYTINPAAAKVLNPQRAMTLTKEEAKTITPEEASKPPSPP
jgi:hypothetical protein